MNDDEIIGRIHNVLSPTEARNWFLAAEREIRDAVLTIARVDGIDVAVQEVRRLYVAWLAAGSSMPEM